MSDDAIFFDHPDLSDLGEKNAMFAPMAELVGALDTLAAAARDTSRPLADRFEAYERYRGAMRAIDDLTATLSHNTPRGERVTRTWLALRTRRDEPTLTLADRTAADFQLAGYEHAARMLADALLAEQRSRR